MKQVWMKRPFRWTFMVTGGVLLLLLAGVIFEETAAAVDQRRIPPPGELVDAGGHRLHLHCVGAGTPTVVVEAGSGLWSLDWQPVLEQVAAETRICAYDRAGYGWSDAPATPRSGPHIVTELNALLREAGETGPFLLVGHSLGGMYGRLYAQTYPHEVAGVMLVDARHEALSRRQPAAIEEAMAGALSFQCVAALLAHFGLARLLGPALYPPPAQFTPDQQAAYHAYAYRPPMLTASYREFERIAETEALLLAGEGLGERPLWVLVPAQTVEMPGDNATAAEFVALLEELQDDFLTKSSRSRLVTVPDSGHTIHIDQPQATGRLILEMLAEIRHEGGE